MSRKSVLIISTSTRAEEIDVTGNPVRIDNLYSSSEYMMTFAIASSAFMGRVVLEGSIMNSPGENDWATIYLTPEGFIDYPKTGQQGRETSTLGFTVKGRYTWVRAKVLRSHLISTVATSLQVATYGAIDRILLNL
jgi:hypothetical protein